MPNRPILIAVALMLSLAMGLRQSLGLFLQPLTRDLGLAVADFTLAIAVQNIAWGVLQPIAGGFSARLGFRRTLVTGAVCYVAGLLVLASARGLVGVTIGAGVLIGGALACTASAMALAVAARAVPVAVRSTVLGLVTAGGSLGSIVAAPLGQVLAEGWGWRAGVLGFAALAIMMIPAAWLAGRVDRVVLPSRGTGADDTTARAALAAAFAHRGFLVMAGAYCVCGMQLIFLATHLPSYLALCGMDPMLSAQALAVIAAFNVAGSLFFGWAGGRWPKQALLGGLYIARSIVLAIYFAQPPTPIGSLVFAAAMGFLWLGVGPLISGSVAEMFGLRWQAMIQGLAFMSHQVGSFAGALGGGVLFDLMGSYDLAWKIGVGCGLVAGTLQLLFAAPKPPRLEPAPNAG
ncbi:MAG: MFS transporter [Reyranella sp.]|uniref:MFS transporter n=1 Tax=Reyranella sp. TaxID=1929291 RepID=UPI001AC342C4|nr:MFS transporter [Reyranella sp.]MBN9086872.1 MFS transporter [Reyranella sp.]